MFRPYIGWMRSVGGDHAPPVNGTIDVGKPTPILNLICRGEIFFAPTIGANDLLIADHEFSIDALLVTNSLKRFARVAGLKLANWAECV